MNDRYGYRSPSWIDYAMTLAAGALLPLAFAPFEYFFLAFPLLAVLFYQWRDPSPRNAFKLGWVFGIGMFLTGVYWVYNSMYVFGHIPRPLSALATLLFAMFLGLFPAVTGWVCNRWMNTGSGWRLLIIFPAAWVLLEWVRGWFFTGFPWLNLGYSQTEQVLSVFAPVFGVYGISWLVAFLSAVLVVLVFSNWKAKLVSILLVAGIASGFVYLQDREWTKPADRKLRVSLVQGNIEQNRKWNPEFRESILQRYIELSRSEWEDSDVIIWPETAIPAFHYQVEEFVNALDRLARERKTDMLVGIVTSNRETREYYNSMMSLGTEKRFYSKQHLVPFGEYIPLQKYLSNLLDLLGLPMSGFSSGDKVQKPLMAGGFKAGMTICYEIAFVEEVLRSLPESNYLVSVSNNTWFGDSSAPHQQLQMARMRAQEAGRYILLATNDGVSAIVNHEGKILKTSPQFQQHVLNGEVQPRFGATPFVQWGNTPVLVFLSVLCLLGFLVARLQNR